MNELNHLFASLSVVTLLFIAFVVWTLIWKGIGLWFSARNYQRVWFVAILILTTGGILEIIYLLFFRRDKQPGTKSLFEKELPGRDPNGIVAETLGT